MVVILLFAGCKDASLDPSATGTIEGTVLDEATGAPLSNVELSTSPASDVVLSDNDGAFAFSDLDVGDYNLRIRKMDYETRSVSVAVREDRATTVQLFMNEEDETTERDLTAEVTSFINRTDEDGNTSVRVEYRILNTGSGTIPEYEVTFRVETDQNDSRLEQIEGTMLREEQSDVGDFIMELDGAEATDATIEEVWFDS
jgi:hypothetical protein